jgi:hypothetical protein
MTLLRHQTLRLGRGAHTSPAEGACVMELASLLVDEPFSDRPECVSPVIGGFLRAYNDLLDDRRRQDLRSYAAAVVGSRAELATEIRRARRCLQFARAHPVWCRPSLLTRLLVRLGRRLPLAGMYAAAAAWHVRRTDAVHRSTLRFLDELVAIERSPERWHAGIELGSPAECPEAQLSTGLPGRGL